MEGAADRSDGDGDGLHKLHTNWVLWCAIEAAKSKPRHFLFSPPSGTRRFDYPGKAKKRTVWESNLRRIATLETVRVALQKTLYFFRSSKRASFFLRTRVSWLRVGSQDTRLNYYSPTVAFSQRHLSWDVD